WSSDVCSSDLNQQIQIDAGLSSHLLSLPFGGTIKFPVNLEGGSYTADKIIPSHGRKHGDIQVGMPHGPQDTRPVIETRALACPKGIIQRPDSDQQEKQRCAPKQDDMVEIQQIIQRQSQQNQGVNGGQHYR